MTTLVVAFFVMLLVLVVGTGGPRAAPTVTARTAPAGFKLEDGYQSLIAFSGNADAIFFEIEVGQPGVDGGEPINTTTQHNVLYRTFAPRALSTLTPYQVKVAYDPCLTQEALNQMINEPDAITTHYPDSSTGAHWGYLQKIDYDPLVEGTMPTATLTIVPTNWDPVNCVEAGPVFVCNGTC